MSTPQDLATTLTAVSPAEYVRFVADWLRRAESLDQAPALTGSTDIDAFVAAATAHAASTSGRPVPA